MRDRQRALASVLRENRAKGPHEKLADLIYAKTGVHCSVQITPLQVMIRTASYADYLLAKSAIATQTTQPILRQVL